MSSSSDTHTTRPSPAPSAKSAKSTETTKSVPAASVDKTPDDAGRLRAFLSILKKYVGTRLVKQLEELFTMLLIHVSYIGLQTDCSAASSE